MGHRGKWSELVIAGETTPVSRIVGDDACARRGLGRTSDGTTDQLAHFDNRVSGDFAIAAGFKGTQYEQVCPV